MAGTPTVEDVLGKVLETTDAAREGMQQSSDTLAQTKVMQAAAQDALDSATSAVSRHQSAPLSEAHPQIEILVRDKMRDEVERQSGGRNTVIRDAQGDPHHMVVIPRFNMQDIDPALGTGPHPAFVVAGKLKPEIFLGKYLASNVNGKAKTLARKAPWVGINFDNALAATRACGAGFGMATNAMYAARALWLMKERGAVEYLGNTNWGRNHSRPQQTGTMLTTDFAPGDTGNTVSAANLTGTGPDAWNDDATPYGVSDLVGNVWEWASGLRLQNGEIQVIAGNDSMLSTVDHGPASGAWKAIMPDGSLVAPGTAGTLKFDAASPGTGNGAVGAPILSKTITNVTTDHANSSCYVEFKSASAAAGTTAPAILKQLGLFPVGTTGVQGGLWMRNNGERLPLRGGDWNGGGICGPFAVGLGYPRSGAHWHVGFRAAFA